MARNNGARAPYGNYLYVADTVRGTRVFDRRRWRAFDAAPYDAVDCVPGTCWASGPAGAVAVLAR